MDIAREERKDQNLKELLQIGTCGLHTVHGSLKHGGVASGWQIDKVLSAIYKILDVSPSRREDYEKVCKDNIVYPLQFCSHRWAENKGVAERALEVWENIVETVNHWVHLPKKQQPNENNKSYERLKVFVKDPLIPVKLKFFAKLANDLNAFLVLFQTDKPMVPFLGQSIEDLIRKFASMFVLADTLKAANTCLSLSKIDFLSASNHKRPADVKLPIPVKVELSDLKKKGKITDTKILQFKAEVISFLSSLCAHLAKKSPIKHTLTRNATCFIPAHLVESPETCERKFNCLLEILYTTQHLSGKSVEEAKTEFPKFIQEIVICHKEEFLGFDIADHRLDSFYFKFLEGKPSLSNLSEVLKMILTLSHGQASVERGFSVNKTILVENLKEESLIAQRIILDYLRANDLDVHEVQITPGLRRSVKSSRQKYGAYLEDMKKKEIQTEKSRKRKLIEDEISELKRRKSLLLETISELHHESDKYAQDAENRNDLGTMKSLLTKSNSFRATAKAKEAEVDECKSQLKELEKKKAGL